MEFSKLMSLTELDAHNKQWSGQTFENDDALLEDAFGYGVYHEEEFRFGLLAARLSNHELASLFLPVGHGLIRGSTGSHVEEVRELYQALSEWQSGKLKDKQRLIDALAKVRYSVLDLPPGWLSPAVPFYRILELGINERLGASLSELWEIEKRYQA